MGKAVGVLAGVGDVKDIFQRFMGCQTFQSVCSTRARIRWRCPLCWLLSFAMVVLLLRYYLNSTVFSAKHKGAQEIFCVDFKERVVYYREKAFL